MRPSLLCTGDDFTIGGEVLPGQIKIVQWILSRFVQPVGESLRELRIDRALHAAKCSSRLTWVRRAAYESPPKTFHDESDQPFATPSNANPRIATLRVSNVKRSSCAWAMSNLSNGSACSHLSLRAASM